MMPMRNSDNVNEDGKFLSVGIQVNEDAVL